MCAVACCIAALTHVEILQRITVDDVKLLTGRMYRLTQVAQQGIPTGRAALGMVLGLVQDAARLRQLVRNSTRYVLDVGVRAFVQVDNSTSNVSLRIPKIVFEFRGHKVMPDDSLSRKSKLLARIATVDELVVPRNSRRDVPIAMRVEVMTAVMRLLVEEGGFGSIDAFVLTMHIDRGRHLPSFPIHIFTHRNGQLRVSPMLQSGGFSEEDQEWFRDTFAAVLTDFQDSSLAQELQEHRDDPEYEEIIRAKDGFLETMNMIKRCRGGEEVVLDDGVGSGDDDFDVRNGVEDDATVSVPDLLVTATLHLTVRRRCWLVHV